MANTYVVKKGDTLWDIAERYLGNASLYKQLAALNNISNPDLIAVGQTIKLDSSGSSGGGSGSGSSSSSSSSNTVTINQFGLQANTDRTLFVTWSWDKANTASYLIKWEYQAGGIWFVGSSSSNSVNKHDPGASRESTYNIPENADRVRVKIKPISETKTTNGTETSYWTANWSTTKTYDVDELPLDTPGTPSARLEDFRLTAELVNLDERFAQIEFQIVKNDKSVYQTGKATVYTGAARYSITVDAGERYKVRARAIASGKYSDWSEYSNDVGSGPKTPKKITTLRATSETSVYIAWEAVTSGDNKPTSYNIEYTTKLNYFDASSQVSRVSSVETTYYEISGIETGEEYFFRVQAVNGDGESAWTDARSIILGKAPTAPTTWSSTTKAITGENLNLYWVHNTEDGSSQERAKLELYINGVRSEYIIENDRPEDRKDETSVYSINTSGYSQGTKIEWRVCTAGITGEYSEWSIQRSIDIYSPPSLSLTIANSSGESINTLTSFPLVVSAVAGPNSQWPITYHLTVIARESYETTDHVGNTVLVSAGEVVYSRHFDTSDALSVALSAGDLLLENNVEYTLSCVVSMNSGLTATATTDFIVAWEDVGFVLNAEIAIDRDTWVAHIRPYVESIEYFYCQVNYDGRNYVITDKVLDSVWGEVINGVTTTTGELVYAGVTGDGDEVFYSKVEKVASVGGIKLAVYRREFDGTFTEIASGLDSEDNIFVTDPHPALDLARYRIVGTSASTGTVSYTDLPGEVVGCSSIIIQWAEDWSYFDTSNADVMEQPAWSGSLLTLPYNIDVSDSFTPDVSLIEYIGRKNPVSYYGTQNGVSSSWSTTIPKNDEETLYALRRLAVWMGDVYVREPSGTGYWANITVSFSQAHRDVTIPVRLEVKRVSGGI